LESYKGRVNDLIHYYADHDLSLRREVHLRRDGQWIPRGRHQLANFGVERHTLVIGNITQFFHHLSVAVTQCSAARAHSSRGREQILGGLDIDFSHPRTIMRFPSDPFERKARRIFFIVPHQISTEESSGAHFPDLGVQHFWWTHSGFPSEHQAILRETLPTHFPVYQGSHFETHLILF
jgi:hypothetical protein